MVTAERITDDDATRLPTIAECDDVDAEARKVRIPPVNARVEPELADRGR
jgi:hypothetical protein